MPHRGRQHDRAPGAPGGRGPRRRGRADRTHRARDRPRRRRPSARGRLRRRGRRRAAADGAGARLAVRRGLSGVLPCLQPSLRLVVVPLPRRGDEQRSRRRARGCPRPTSARRRCAGRPVPRGPKAAAATRTWRRAARRPSRSRRRGTTSPASRAATTAGGRRSPSGAGSDRRRRSATSRSSAAPTHAACSTACHPADASARSNTRLAWIATGTPDEQAPPHHRVPEHPDRTGNASRRPERRAGPTGRALSASVIGAPATNSGGATRVSSRCCTMCTVNETSA